MDFVLASSGLVCGSAMNSLYELSVTLGAFHGNLRNVMHAKMIASDQMSAGCGSYFLSSYTSGARYGSEPTTPVHALVSIISLAVVHLTGCHNNIVFERILEDACTSKVNDFHNAELVNHHVVQFQIPMREARAM